MIDINPDNYKKIVKNGYERVTEVYSRWRQNFERWDELREFCDSLKTGAKALDMGCGNGIPVAKYLVEHGGEVVGIDVSENMLEMARKNIPDAEFIKMDMLNMRFSPACFDGLTAFYSIFHVKRDFHADLFRSFYEILKPGGLMLISLGSDEWEGIEDFQGVDMFWSNYSPEKSLELLREAGFEIIFGRNVVTYDERHYWILAKKNA